MQIHQMMKVSFLFTLIFASFGAAAAKEAKAVPGEFLVKIANRNKRIKALESELGGEVIREIREQNILILRRPIVENPEFSLQSIRRSKAVVLAEPNYIYNADKASAEPDYGKLWGLNNIGQSDTKQNGTTNVDISAEKAWDISTGQDDVVVAVIDTGIDLTHPDLAQNMWTNELEAKGVAGVDDDANGFVDDIYGMNFSDPAVPSNNPNDDNGHGSHCSGTIGAIGNNNFGVVGVNWKVKLMPVKFLGSAGGGTLEGAIRAIDYATQMGAHIMSNSWGGGAESQLLKEAIERAEAAGALFVAAAGNDGMDNDSSPHYPSSYAVKNILSVAAIDNRGDIAAFSNTGKNSVHIAAPGVNIFSTYKEGGYEWLSGTSMATPHVSGVAALVFSQNRQMDYSQLKARILKTVKQMPSLRNKVSSNGLVNAYNALTDSIEPPDLNDPFYWPSKPIAVSNSIHPYKANTNETYEVVLAQGNEFSIYFDQFETERNFDKLSFFDRAGNLLFEMTGIKSDSFSPTIKGSYVKLVFTSDASVEKQGFSATRIHYR